MKVDKACDNKKCVKNKDCARHEAYLNGDKNFKTHGGNEQKGCGKFIQK